MAARATPHLLINGLSVGSGGGYTVARELFLNLAHVRPDWRVSIALTTGRRLHEEMRSSVNPANAEIVWAPAETASISRRNRYERTGLADWARENQVQADVQLNGMLIPRFPAPSLCHFQDPWPYRPQAWSGLRDRLVALGKRRAHRRSLRDAWATGFTSQYLRDLLCQFHRVQPRRADVFYNGLPVEWAQRSFSQALPWETRPLELISVSNVTPYKRQELVIRAMPDLLRRPGLDRLIYRIAGEIDDKYRQHLLGIVQSLKLADHVVIEGRVSTQRLTELFRNARAFVLMSVCESFGIPAVEAMSFGTPVVTSDCCAMPEVCGNAAELCATDNLPALTDSLARVLTDSIRAAELQVAGFARIQCFNWRSTAEQMAAVLDEAFESHTPPSSGQTT